MDEEDEVRREVHVALANLNATTYLTQQLYHCLVEGMVQMTGEVEGKQKKLLQEFGSMLFQEAAQAFLVAHKLTADQILDRLSQTGSDYSDTDSVDGE